LLVKKSGWHDIINDTTDFMSGGTSISAYNNGPKFLGDTTDFMSDGTSISAYKNGRKFLRDTTDFMSGGAFNFNLTLTTRQKLKLHAA
jgi:hypothetical protein